MKKWIKKFKKNPKRKYVFNWESKKANLTKHFPEFYDRLGILINAIIISQGGIEILVKHNTFKELLKGYGKTYKLCHQVLLNNVAFHGDIGTSFLKIIPVLYFLAKALLN